MAVPLSFPLPKRYAPMIPKHIIYTCSHTEVFVWILHRTVRTLRAGGSNMSLEPLKITELLHPNVFFAIIWVLTPSFQKVSCSQVPCCLCVFLLQLSLQRTSAPSLATDLGEAAALYWQWPKQWVMVPIPDYSCVLLTWLALCLAISTFPQLTLFLLLSLPRSFHLLWRLEARNFVLLIFVLSLPFLPTPNISHSRTKRLCLVYQHLGTS